MRRYGNGRGVGPVALTVGAGEVVAVCGPNGSGKSTLLRCLATRTRPGEGSLRWWGESRPQRVRHRLGIAFELSAHVDEASARQNLGFFAATRAAAGHPVTAAALDTALARSELTAVADEPVGSYSFGMRRRLLLAEALLGEPDLLLLDEPTVGLDVGAAERLVEQLRRRVGRGAAVCLASNDTTFVERVADRVCFLLQGQVLRTAPLRDLLAEVQGHRELRLRCRGLPPLPALRAVPGVDQAALTTDGVVLTALRRDGLVADVLRALRDVDRELLDLQIRDPDLADVFLRLAGRPLDG